MAETTQGARRTMTVDVEQYRARWRDGICLDPGKDVPANFLEELVAYSGLLPRLLPSPLTLAVDRRIGQLRRLLVQQCRAPKQTFRRLKARWMGYDAWTAPTSY